MTYYALTLAPLNDYSPGGHTRYRCGGHINGVEYDQTGTIDVLGSGLWSSVKGFAVARGGDPDLALASLAYAALPFADAAVVEAARLVADPIEAAPLRDSLARVDALNDLIHVNA